MLYTCIFTDLDFPAISSEVVIAKADSSEHAGWTAIPGFSMESQITSSFLDMRKSKTKKRNVESDPSHGVHDDGLVTTFSKPDVPQDQQPTQESSNKPVKLRRSRDSTDQNGE
jgi:hypothetical protein